MWRPTSNSMLLQQCRQRRYTLITVVSLAVIILAFFLGFAAFGGDPVTLTSLKLVHIVFRHGDRSPTYSYPNDPHINYVWKEGMGALTNKGKREMLELGQNIRKRYHNLLGEAYDAEAHYMQSSYSPRCQMSAATFLAGLFPPQGHQIWNPDLLWQPIPVNPIPRNIDNKIAAKAKCRAFDEEKARSDGEINRNLDPEFRKVLSDLTERTGDNITDIARAEMLYYTLKIQSDHDLDIPSWAESVFRNELAKMAFINLESYTHTPLLKKLQAGPMLKEWVDNMSQNRSSRRTANFYSAHDLTLVNLMNTLGFDDLDFPEYGAALVVEYHETDGEKRGFLQIYYYKNYQTTRPTQLKLKNCLVDCSLEDFTRILAGYINWEDWNAECKNPR